MCVEETCQVLLQLIRVGGTHEAVIMLRVVRVSHACRVHFSQTRDIQQAVVAQRVCPHLFM